MYLVLEFHFRSKSSPEVKRQIDIFDHNSNTIGRSDLKQRSLDSSRRAAQKCCSYFFRPMHRFRDICDFYPSAYPAGGVLSSPMSVCPPWNSNGSAILYIRSVSVCSWCIGVGCLGFAWGIVAIMSQALTSRGMSCTCSRFSASFGQ